MPPGPSWSDDVTNSLLGLVLTLTRIMSEAGRLDEALQAVLVQLVESLSPITAGYILVSGDKSNRPELKAACGYPSKPGEAPTLTGRDLADQALRKREPQVSSGDGILALPLVLGENVLGVLVLHGAAGPSGLPTETVASARAAAQLLVPYIHSFLLKEELQALRTSREASCFSTDLLAVLSHQIRSPLAVIKGYASTLMRQDMDLDPETTHEFLATIVAEADKATAIVTDILDYSALEANHLELNKEPVLLRNLCQKIIHELKQTSPKHRFALAFSPQVHLVEADPARIEQVIRNLIDNAIKYSDHGLIVVQARKTQDEVIVSVADQGIGIQPEHLNRLFEKFYRVKNPKRQVAGTGLGLPIARQIVEAHGGRIWATSKPGSGSTFYFSLPCN